MKNPLHKLLLSALASAMLIVQACHSVEIPAPPTGSPSSYDADVLLKWNLLFLDIERFAPGYRPGPAPRALGYLGLSAYECVAPGMPTKNSLEAQMIGLDLPEYDNKSDIYWPAAINESYAFLMSRFFFHMENEHPDLFNQIEQTRYQLHEQYAQETTAETLQRSEEWGRAIAMAIYKWESDDAIGHNAFLNPQPVNYTPPAGAGKWYHENGARAVFPYWGQVRTFALQEADKICNPPIPYSELPGSLFYDQAEEVYNTVKFIRQPHTDPADQELAYEMRWIAIFWSDDLLNLTFSPPTRLMAIANQVVEREGVNLAEACEIYAKLGMALHDNGVAIWASKYHYNVERPDTYIHRVIAQHDPVASEFVTLLDNPLTGEKSITPAFPAYPSGHSGFGGAGAKILSSFFEFNDEHPGTYSFVDRCHENRAEFLGTPRTYSSLSDAGIEDAMSRIPLGVHFRMDCDEGLRVGRTAAQRVLDLDWEN